MNAEIVTGWYRLCFVVFVYLFGIQEDETSWCKELKILKHLTFVTLKWGCGMSEKAMKICEC